VLTIQEHRENNFTVSRAQSTVNNTLSAIGFGSHEKIYIMSGSEILSVKSSDNEDSRIGTGARTLIIKGGRRINNDQIDYITETLELNGTSYVLTAYQYSEIYSIEVEKYGTIGTNKGEITISKEAEGSYEILFNLEALEGVKKNSLFVAPSSMGIKQLNVFINSVDGDKIDFTSVFFEVIIKKLPALPFGKFSSLSFDPDSSPGAQIARYMCSGGVTTIEMYDYLNPSDIIYCMAKNVTNTDSYTVSTEVVLYER
jgi:hypothetical protein